MKLTGTFLSLLTGLTLISLQSKAQSKNMSTDLMCRNKAKEIAAETYKNCITDIRQGQIKNLRQEYETKLSELKKHYDKELKRIANDSGAQTDRQMQDKQQIDKQQNLNKTDKTDNKSDLSNNTDLSSIEIVEIPAQEE